MVTAFKLDDLVSTCCTTSEPDSTHRGFRARARHSHLLKARHKVAKAFSKLDLNLGRTAKTKTILRRFHHGVPYTLMVVAHNHGAPRQDVIDVLIAIGVKNIGAV